MEVNVYDRLSKAKQGILYISVHTTLDIAFAQSILTQKNSNPKPTHSELAFRSFANDTDDRKSMGRFVIFLGNSIIS